MWKVIESYPNYAVSETGLVKNIKTNRTLKPVETYNGYLRVCLNGRLCRIHILVAEAFIGKIENGMQVNHKDEDKKNNSVENLEICSSVYNKNYGTRNNRISKTLSIPVDQYTIDGKYIKTYSSLIEASKGICANDKGSGISKACRGIWNSYRGYKWRYAI